MLLSEPKEIAAPDPETMWHDWHAAPTQEANQKMLTALDPMINRAAQTHVGKVSPLVKSRARVMALQGLKTYDPSKGRLQSHLYNHLQGLKRYAAQAAAGVYMPERVSLDRRAVSSAHNELTDELGRDPTHDEIANRTGLSTKRISHISRHVPAMAQGYFANMGSADDPYDPAVQGSHGPSPAWMQAIRDDLHPIDQQIFDWSQGNMENREIARRLKLSPGAISQRKLRIQQFIDQEAELSPF